MTPVANPPIASAFWRVEMWWYERAYQTMASAGVDIPVSEANTAEQAIIIAKLWRKVTEPLSRISVQYRTVG